MAVRWAITGGTWSSPSTWNDGATLGIPKSDDDVWSNGFTVNMDVNATVISLNNSARSRTIATPAMTANNAPSTFVAAASSAIGAFQPYLAFDRNYNSASNYWNSSSNTGWISIDFGNGNSTIIDGYTIYGYNIQAFNPRNWTFEGSNDNSSWTVLQTVTSATAIPSSGTYSVTSIGNTTAYRYYRVNITANGGQTTITIVELELYQSGTAALAAGGSFNFNTSGVTVSTTSTSQGASNLFTVTNTTGTTSLNVSNTIIGVIGQTTITYSSAGNFNITCPNLLINSNASGLQVINKTGSGLLTVNGNSICTMTSIAGGSARVLQISNGDCVINGNVIGAPGAGGSTTTVQSVFQSSGTLTINGNVTPVGLSAINVVQCAVSFSGTRLILNGNTNGGDGLGIVSSGIVDINGTLRGGNSVYANNTITINITGDTYAGLQPAVNCSAFPNSVVNLTGNMYNTLGRMAIWCPNIFISNSATTLWRMDIGGGLTRTLYSADSFPNLPSTSDVRRLVSYGPASGLTGTMWVASPSNIRKGVLTDNTVGTADITATDILNFINTSSDPLAVRMRTVLTDNSAGQLISEYNFV
jgi:hypothetical protein